MTSVPCEAELESFGDSINVAIVGASGGLGAALANRLGANHAVSSIFRLARSPQRQVTNRDWLHLDLEDEGTIETAAAEIERRAGELHMLIVASGVLHDGTTLRPEKSWKAISASSLEQVFRINAAGPALVAKHFLPLLAANRKTAFAAVSARVGSIGDNDLGGWYAYRASKAALNMIIRTLSVELARKRPQALCVGLHPGTVDTPLSKPFQQNIPSGGLFTPDRSAAYLTQTLDRLTPADSGWLYAWDGSRIPN